MATPGMTDLGDGFWEDAGGARYWLPEDPVYGTKKKREEEEAKINANALQAMMLRQVREMWDKSGLAHMKHNPERMTKAGIVTVFDMAVVYGDPVEALCFYLNRRGRKKKFGDFRGWMIGECPYGDSRMNFEYYKPDPKVEDRIKRRRAFAKRREPVWYLQKHHTKGTGTMDHFIGKPKRKPKKLVRLKGSTPRKQMSLTDEGK